MEGEVACACTHVCWGAPRGVACSHVLCHKVILFPAKFKNVKKDHFAHPLSPTSFKLYHHHHHHVKCDQLKTKLTGHLNTSMCHCKRTKTKRIPRHPFTIHWSDTSWRMGQLSVSSSSVDQIPKAKLHNYTLTETHTLTGRCNPPISLLPLSCLLPALKGGVHMDEPAHVPIGCQLTGGDEGGGRKGSREGDRS